MNRSALIVDDEPWIAALVKGVLEGAGFTVAVAHTAAEASEELKYGDIDVAIIDISLGRGPSGIDLVHLAHQSYPATALLLLTRYPDLRTAGMSGEDLPPGCGFLCKDSIADASTLVDAVERALQEDGFAAGSSGGPLAALTDGQLEVLRLVAQGYTTAEIARRRERTTSAVEKMLSAIYQRLGIDAEHVIHPRVEAIRIYATAAGLPERAE